MERKVVPKPTEELEKTCVFLQQNGIDVALLTSMENVTYASGFEVPVHIGPIHAFSGMQPMAAAVIFAREGTGYLMVAEDFLPAAQRQSILPVVSFETFGHFSAVDSEQSYLQALEKIFVDGGLQNSRAVLGMEAQTLPFTVASWISSTFPGLQMASANPSLMQARRIKTKREIGLLKHAANIADAGQLALIQLAQGFEQGNELELWSVIEQAMIRAAGGRITITGEFVSGNRIGVIAPGGPADRSIQAGDMGLMDISPRKIGYWGDCTNTVVFGKEPTMQQKRYFTAAREAFEAARDALRPGVRCCDVEAAARQAFARNGFPISHYTGHQIGVSVNELPRIVLYDDSIVEAGMVFAVEPGIYGGVDVPYGARAERMVVVGEQENEVLNEFPWGIS